MKCYPDYVVILEPYYTTIEMRFRILASLDAEEFLTGKVTVAPVT